MEVGYQEVSLEPGYLKSRGTRKADMLIQRVYFTPPECNEAEIEGRMRVCHPREYFGFIEISDENKTE